MEAMEMSRTEYPSIVAAVRPSTAVRIIRDRLHKGHVLNQEIAEWLQERRRAEEVYASALLKLSKKPSPSDNSELGVFSAPWIRVVESTSTIAVAHQHFAQKLDNEVERLIREFCARNSDWSGMKSLESNLNLVAKSIESSEERAEKLRKRGTKAKAQQVAEAASAVSNAMADWGGQAPYVFEKLQAADEARCNSLRDAFTRLQTLEHDRAQASAQSAESALSSILDVNTNDEIRTFTNKVTAGQSKLDRPSSRVTNLNHGHPATPSVMTDDSVSVQSSHSGGAASAGGGSHGGLGLKRLGTVLRNRNRNSMFHRSASPDKRSERSAKFQSSLPVSPPPSRLDTSTADNHKTMIPLSSAPNVEQDQMPDLEGNTHSDSSSPVQIASQTNKLNTPSVNITSDNPQTDSEGYSIPPPNLEPNGGGLGHYDTEEHQHQFKVEIKNDVIHEEEEEADAALSKVANTLRAQNTVSRKVRGRRDVRDVRNTIFVANPTDITEHLTGSPPSTPVRNNSRPSNVTCETGSDTQSIKSSRSVISLVNTSIKHPELTSRGLCISLVEMVSLTCESGQPTKSHIAGEIALAYNQDANPETNTPITIRLDNFSILEKVAPNPAFISAVLDRVGEYTITPQTLRKTAVGFKYQVRVEEESLHTYSPITVTPVWRVEGHQSSVIISWKSNPQFRRLNESKTSFCLRNLVFIAGIEGVPAISCQSKPVGTFSREKARLIWKLGDFDVDIMSTDCNGGKLLARFATDGMARPRSVEVRWEICDAENFGSGLTLSIQSEITKTTEDEVDPFADVGSDEKSVNTSDPDGSWSKITAVSKIMSGKHTAA